MSNSDSSSDDPQPPARLSPKEYARQQRRAAYQRAKERRASDPKQLAFKEAMKLRQREAYQASKERRRARDQERKATASPDRAATKSSQLILPS